MSILARESSFKLNSVENHLKNKNIIGIAKTKMGRIEKLRAKMNGIIIVPRINIKTWFRIGRDCKMVIC